MHIALLGTGLLGHAVAKRLHAVGHKVSAYNRSPEKMGALAQAGIRITSQAAEAMATAEAVLLLLSDTSAIQAVIFGPEESRAIRGRTIIQMGTIGPQESQALQQAVERLGGRYMEAPVLGSIAEALAGHLLIMVGSTTELFIEQEALLRSFGSDVRLIGPVGTAVQLKLALNQLIAAEITAFALSLGLVRQAGITVEDFMALLRKSALYAPMFDKKLPRLTDRNYDRPNFSTRHLLKDVNLVLDAATQAGLAAGGLEEIRSLLQDTIDLGLGEMDYSAVYERIDPAGQA
ncbi:NAD(P)-dependent oxidoreductase [Nitrospirales bacterium NOB]|nr:NAD(P)-dependent oxidoreductase [Nitrospirales bacterium NOB]